MIKSRHSSTKPHQKAASRAASAPKQAPKHFKSAELVEDSDDDEDGRIPPALDIKSGTSRLEELKLPSSEHKQPATSGLAARSPKLSQIRKSSTSSASELGPNTSKNIVDGGGQPVKAAKLAEVSTVGEKRTSNNKTSTQTDSIDSEKKDLSIEKNLGAKQERARVSSPDKPKSSKTAVAINSFGEKKKTPDVAASKDGDSISGSADDISDESEVTSESNEESSAEDEDEGTSTIRPRSGKNETVAITAIPPYAPPPDFEAAPIAVQSTSKQAELFSPTSLQGKQIWHITVPADIPISSVTDVARKSLQDGSSTLAYNGADYGLIAEAKGTRTGETILVLSAEDNMYKHCGHSISKMLHLQQLTLSSNHLRHSSDLPTFTASTDRSPYQKPAPQQPEGLRMRYRPFGDIGSDSSSDDKAKHAEQMPQFRVPQGTGTASPKKRKLAEREAEAEVLGGSQNPKKSRKANTLLASSSGVPLRKDEKSSTVKEMPIEHHSPVKDNRAKEKKKSHDSSTVMSEFMSAPPSLLANGEKTSPLNETPAKRLSPVKPRDKKRSPDRSTNLPRSQLTHAREPDEPLRKPDQLSSQKADSSTPTVNGTIPSPSQRVKEDAAMNPKQKSKRKHRKYKTDEPTDQSSPKNTSADINSSRDEEAVSLGARSNHDRDTTAGAESANKETSPNRKKQLEVEEEKQSSKKKSKHEGETPEERVKRKAERKRRKELKAAYAALKK